MDGFQDIERQVEDLIRPLLAAQHVDLVELSCRPSAGRWLLRCLVDTTGGITLDELSGLNRAIGALLDERNVVPGPYVLEVSSPGLDRPLKHWKDFERAIGRRIRVSTLLSIDGRREHVGELLSASEEAIVLKLDDGDKMKVELAHIAWAHREIDFP
jgi:ribosome maturation factor RimP